MRLASRLFVVTFLLGVSTVVTRFSDVQASPKPDNPTAIVTFENGYDFASDVFYGGGAPVPYVNGVDNIVARFYGGGTGDVTLNLIDSSRKFHGTVVCAEGEVCSAPPAATFSDGWFLNIHKITDMLVGETRLTQAGFIAAFGVQRKGKSGYGNQYHFSWCHDGQGATGDLFDSIAPLPGGCLGQETNGSLMVAVVRDNASGGVPRWTVSTDPLTDTPVGPISELKAVNNNGTSSLGLYKTSFRLTILCQTRCDTFPQP